MVRPALARGMLTRALRNNVLARWLTGDEIPAGAIRRMPQQSAAEY